MATRLERMEEVHQMALNYINYCLKNPREPDLQVLAQFLLETEENPYGFLPEHWAPALSTSTGFQSLLGHIHHALYDDGEISFPIVNGRPRIAFVWRNEDNYADYVLTETEKYMRDRGSEYRIEHCNDVYDFINRFNEAFRNDVRNHYIQTAARFGFQMAEDQYSNYEHFNWDWQDDPEIISEVNRIRAALMITRDD